jgi:hypothetical protein
MTLRERRTGQCLEPQVILPPGSTRVPASRRGRGRGCCRDGRGRADVLPRGELGASAIADAHAAVSVRGSNPPHPPTTSTEGVGFCKSA